MALLFTFFINTPCSTDLHGQLLTFRISNKLARLFLHILCGAAGLVDSATFFRSLAIAHLLHRGVALSHGLIHWGLLEGDPALLLEVLLADFLLCWLELGDVGVVALLNIPNTDRTRLWLRVSLVNFL